MRCPNCGSEQVIKKGMRKTKYKTKQRYLCKQCKKTFDDTKTKHTSYPTKVILYALSTYNKGHTLDKTVNLVNKRFKTQISTSTLHRWIAKNQHVLPYVSLRSNIKKQFGTNVVVSKDFTYNGLAYNFKYHKGKLSILGSRSSKLVSYIQQFDKGCPDFFDGIENRCSKLKIKVSGEKKQKESDVCKLSGFALKGCSSNRQRHSFVETFLLHNDDRTVASELPVWMYEKNLATSIAGHIDLVQVYDNKITIMDYKPNACRENDEAVMSQLYLYASALSFRTGLPLNRFMCAWFDEKDYFEFSPVETKVQYVKK